MFKGSFVAIVTPFKNGKVDEDAYRELLEFQIEGGIDGIVPCGTTGEAATLSTEEHKRVIDLAVETVAGRVPVIAGTGSNSTREAVDITASAKKAGCDGALIVTPYYNKPTPEGQYRHYMEIASKVDIPIMLYNVPSRTGTCMLPSTIARLSKADNIVAVKEASGSVQQAADILSLCDLAVMSGDDSLAFPLMALGGTGVVSVVANIVPDRIHALTETFLSGKIEESRKIHFEIMELCHSMFIETNPLPVKTALSLMGKIDIGFRLPLCEMEKANQAKLEEVLKKYKLI